jgi:hypothetical protein
VSADGRNAGFVFGSLLASTATLVCCVLPAIMVSIGAGATMVAMVSAFPQLVWLSEHKGGVFLVAGLLLLGSGVVVWRARYLPCPVDPAAARQCAQLRRFNVAIYGVALLTFATGATFAYLLPLLA